MWFIFKQIDIGNDITQTFQLNIRCQPHWHEIVTIKHEEFSLSTGRFLVKIISHRPNPIR